MVQSKVCTPDEVTVLLKILVVLYVLLVIGLSVFSTSTSLQSWHPYSVRDLQAGGSDGRTPASLMHNMSDAALFRYALDVERQRKRTHLGGGAAPKVSFMFLTVGPLPLAPLWEKYFEGHRGFYSIYIHEHPPYHANYSSSSVFHNRQIPSQKVEWGRLSMVEAEKRLIANALLDLSNAWFIVLSPSCIPVYDFATTYDYLKRSRHSFVDAFDVPGPDSRGRYNQNLSPLIDITDWRKGAQWIEVDRELALRIVNDTKYYPMFDQLRKEMVLPEEHYIPTMLTITSRNLIANRSLTWTDWSRGGLHPATFGVDDISEEFINRIRQDRNCSYNDRAAKFCFLFARKFSPSALQPLLRLAPIFLVSG